MINLEAISEGINNEIDKLEYECETKAEIREVISNLRTLNDKVYQAFEEIDGEEKKRLEEENDILKTLLADRLSWEEKTDIRIRYGIEVYLW